MIAESLRMYPEPPLLIRRALTDDVLPKGGAGFETKIQRGTDIFLALYVHVYACMHVCVYVYLYEIGRRIRRTRLEACMHIMTGLHLSIVCAGCQSHSGVCPRHASHLFYVSQSLSFT